MMTMIDDFDMLTIEDVNVMMGREEIDYDDYMEAFEEDTTERDEFFTTLAENEDLPF